MSAPQNLDELFAVLTEIGEKNAGLVGHAWKIGMRDGLSSAAQEVRRIGEFNGWPPEVAEVFARIAEGFDLQCHGIELPDLPGSGDNQKEGT